MQHLEKKERQQGNFLEKLLFNHRPVVLIVFALITVVMGWNAMQLRPEASFLRMIPTYHPFVKNFITHRDELKGMGNVIRIAVETTEGNIFSSEYMDLLKKVNDEVFFVPGVDRAGLKSLWTPSTRWMEVTEEGFAGGRVIPDGYDGSPASLKQLRINIYKSGQIGRMVANDFKSSIILVALNDVDPDTGKPLNYQKFSQSLEKIIRQKYQSDTINIHITGFAKIVGDLIDGASQVLMFFAVAFVILLILLYYTTRCLRSTAVRAISSLVAVVWQLGLLRLLGYGLNPYSMLVPFLMFALGVSHGIQMGNGVANEMLDGTDKYLATRRAYGKLYIPGLAALLTDAIGFATLFIIVIGVIQDIAVGATVGVIVVAFTDLMLLPVMISYTGISRRSLDRLALEEKSEGHFVWRLLAHISHPKVALVVLLIAALGMGYGLHVRKGLQVGDLDVGAPELRPDSRYNMDNAYMNKHYAASSDVFVVMLTTPPQKNGEYPVVVATDRLAWKLRHTEGVQSVISYVDVLKMINSAFNEGNLKCWALPRSQMTLDSLINMVPFELANHSGSFSPILVFLKDHTAQTLQNVVQVANDFGVENNDESMQFLLAAGNAGIEAATNEVIEKAQFRMTMLVYGVIFLVCLLTYRSLFGALCIVLPLTLTSVLCEALMAKYGIGVKVATLPVIAIGVGIGVDYGIYIYNMLLQQLKLGEALPKAYFNTLKTTGKSVAFTGITLGIGVGTWAFSPIKFQADMGILLAFMFIWNMIGALCLIPALACVFRIPQRIVKSQQ